jgi:hypothetical protein
MSEPKSIDYTAPLCVTIIVMNGAYQPPLIGEGEMVIEWSEIVRVSEFLFPQGLPVRDDRSKCVIYLKETSYVVVVDWQWMKYAYCGYVNWKKTQMPKFYMPQN